MSSDIARLPMGRLSGFGAISESRSPDGSRRKRRKPTHIRRFLERCPAVSGGGGKLILW